MQESDKLAMRYVKKVSANPEMSHNKLLARIRENSSVLEFGPASGAMTKVLCEDLACKVSIVEIDRECYENAMQYAVAGVCADIEQLAWEQEFEGQTFDYIVFADVLEHLKEPEKVLQEVQKFLKPEGSVLISVPNIAHNSIIIQLLNNEFIYQSTGILDYTHVRHFTFGELVKLCTNAGFGVVYMDAVYIGVGKNEFDVSYADLEPQLAAFLRKRPFGEVYQHILEIRKKEYVENNKIEVQNCLGTPKDYAELAVEVGEEQNADDVNGQTMELLSQNPNLFFATNEEIARLRLEINEMYHAIPELEQVVRLRRRVQEYQEEVRGKNNHIRVLINENEQNQKATGQIVRLEALVKEKDLQIAQLESRSEETEQQLRLLQKEKNVLEREVSAHKEQIAVLEQTVRNKEGHVEQLLEVEREYEREKSSKSYRIGMIFRKISTTLFPVNSKRRFFAKLLRHPIKTLKLFNFRRMKNCFIILKTEGVDSALNHLRLVEEYEGSRSVPLNNENLTIVEVNETPKSIEDYEKLTFPKWDKPEVSIVIPVYNQFDYTYHCLESILKHSGDATYEVIIANDCSTDLTAQMQEIVEGVNVVTNEKNLRFLLNCNNAAKKAKGKYILFLNNDTQVQDNWLMPLIELMERDATIGMVGSKLIYSDGYLQEAGGILWKDASAWNYGNRQNPNDSEFNYVREVDYISGAAIMIRESLWKEIGGFDERFVPAYCEDSDLAFEVRKHGYKVVYQPKSVVVHFEGISNGTDVTSGQKKYQVDNQVKFLEKWKNELEANHFENGTNVFLARERSKNQKHVLVIDHYVPQYDKDAGSKTTFMYLKMLVNKGYKVTFLGDNFYQHEPYTSELQQLGIFVLYGPKYAENWKQWLEENIQYFDVFYLNRPHISVKYIDFIKERTKAKIIYYGHDLHFLRLKREYEISGEEHLLKESDEWLEKELYLMKRADMNYYPSETEVVEIHKIDPTIPVKAITAYVYEEFNDVKYDMNDRQGLLFVGGFGHGPNLDAVLWFLEKIYPEVYKRIGAPFYIVGSKAPAEITELKMDGVVVKGFVSEEELQELYNTSRMAVVPLRYGAGVKGKVVEAMYYGLPIVTTSVGAEGIIGIEDIAVVKDSIEELIEEICAVYNDADKLKQMAQGNSDYIRQYFGTEAVWSIIEKDFN